MAKFTKTTTETITVTCPDCASDHVIKSGKQSGEQRYRCMGCDKWFRHNGMAPGHRVPSEQIGLAIRLFYSGMSYKQIGETMADAFDIPEPSKSNIYAWVKEYTDLATAAMEDYPAQVGKEWVADEMVVNVGGRNYWLFNVMDADTRFVLAAYLTPDRNTRAARTALALARERSATHPEVLKTDGLRSYRQALPRAFPTRKVQHTVSKGIRAQINNNLSERLQGTFRDRDKTLRGLEGRETGQSYIDGLVLHYNYFRPHESLDNKRPAEAAGAELPFKDWDDVAAVKRG